MKHFKELREAKKTPSVYHYVDHKSKFPERTNKGHYYVGHTDDEQGRKGANIMKHREGGYFAAPGSLTRQEGGIHDTPEAAARAFHAKRNETLAEADTALTHILKNPGKKLPMNLDPNRPFDPDPPKKNPSAVAGKYGQGFSTAKHLAKQGMASVKKEEASPMIKPPKNEFANKEDAFAHAKKHGGKVMKKTFTHPTSGMKHVSYVVREEAELDEAKYQKLSAHQKFKNSMKRAGYDMDAGAKRLQDLLDKQKKEREEREKQSVAEGSLTEMDKSSPQPGRNGKVSHKTYGSRDNYKLGDPERMAKQVSAEKAKKDALDILKKQGMAGVKEDLELDEAAFAPTMRKAIAAHERGDHKMAKYHLDNAKTARYALKSTDISKHKDLLDKYKELRNMHEDVELDEAGPFSYGSKPPRKGSVAYNALMKRKEQEKNKPPIEPKDQMVGTAKFISSQTK